MTHYRLYFLNAANEITDAVDIDCETEAQAFAAAWDLADGGRVEIWQGKRKVGVSIGIQTGPRIGVQLGPLSLLG